ncbi:MAG TPA: hypothetical protein VMZ03_01430 [Chitinophagaceae bacterium]|nr:hypothetical protein [Chitinophagaceae bacterium]
MAKKYWWWLLPLCTFLSACPFESTVPMQAGPVEPLDSSLVGYWYGIIKDGSDYFGIEALDITKRSDSVYAITRYGKGIKGDMIMPDTAYFTGYTSWIGEQQFMNIEGSIVSVEVRSKKSPKVTTQKVYYVSAIRRSNDTLDVRTLTESFSTKKYFSGPEEFRQLVSDMLGRKKNIYDDQYSLKYHRIPKPAKLY